MTTSATEPSTARVLAEGLANVEAGRPRYPTGRTFEKSRSGYAFAIARLKKEEK